MKQLFCLLFSIAFYLPAATQKHLETYGNKSPIILGANEKINYISHLKIASDIPAKFPPYLTGLLLSNRIASDTSSINRALNVWFKKYAELKSLVAAIQDTTLKSKGYQLLDNADFSGVEILLHTKSNFAPLMRTFPETYKTNGTESPIIIGDFATVTYIVNEVIFYKLPESVTANLLEELSLKNGNINSQAARINVLNKDLVNKEKIIKNWVDRFRSIDSTLKTLPGKIYNNARLSFEQGNFRAALKIIDSLKKNDQLLAKTYLLKAQILLLQVSVKNHDSVMEEADKSYSLAINLQATGRSLFEFGSFIINNNNPNGQNSELNIHRAVYYLERALDSTVDTSSRLAILFYLGIGNNYFDKVRSNQCFESAIQLINDMEPVSDSSLIELKSSLYFFLSDNLSIIDDLNAFSKTIAFADSSVTTLYRVPSHSETDFVFKARAWRQYGKCLSRAFDTRKARECYKNALNIFRDSVSMLSFHALGNLYDLLIDVATMYKADCEIDSSFIFLDSARKLLEPRINLKNQTFLLLYRNAIDLIVENFSNQYKNDSAIVMLNRLRVALNPFMEVDPNYFLFLRANVNADIGKYYLLLNQFDSAQSYLRECSNYYRSNINMHNSFELFANCMQNLNTVLIKKSEIKEVLLYNDSLLAVINQGMLTNKLIYEDFIPLVYSQIADVYISLKKYDSANNYSSKALELFEQKRKRFPMHSPSDYYALIYQAIKIHLYLNDLTASANLAQRFISFSDITGQVFRSNINFFESEYGNYLSSISQLYISHATDAIQTDSSIKVYLAIADNYYSKAVEFYERSSVKYINEKYIFAQSLCDHLNALKNCITHLTTVENKKKATQSFCKIYNLYNTVIAELPDNKTINTLKVNSKLIASGICD